jgi:subfamily B ATP-binding cassette protein HlyB/CyaB
VTAALVLFLGAQAVMNGEMSIGGLIAFNMLLVQAVQPIVRLSQLWQDFQQTQVSMERLGDVLDCPVEPRPSSQAALPSPRGTIQLSNVTFRYRPDLQPVLMDCNLTIAAGEVIGVVGSSGSGKSTMAKLLQRFYKPERGQVLVDGIDIAHVDPAWLRRHVAVVQQDSVLFNKTVHDNIALANPAMSRAQVVEVARLAGADEFIVALPQGYDTLIEERGANLSGGQRQRIAIARALATRPRILILDEATSSLDYESERMIRNNMARIVEGRTVIIIAHRLAAVRDCNRILALKDGKVSESGTHEELVAAPESVYGRLWRIQTEFSARRGL